MLSYFVFALIGAVSAHIVHDGKCPELKPVENFNLTAYQGTWYEVQKYPLDDGSKAQCHTTEYKLEGDALKVKNAHVIDGVQKYVEGTAKLAADANKSGKLALSLKFGDVTKDTPLLVLATDYTNYAIAYNCKYDEKNKSHTDTAVILSRNKKLEGDAKTAVDNYLKNIAKELDQTKFQQTDYSETACKFNNSSPITEPPAH